MSGLIWLCLLVAAPDRAPLADEWGYRPEDGSTVAVNPPSLTWVHEKEAATYTIQWADNAGFERAETVGGIPWSAYTHSRALKPGQYWWRYRIADAGGAVSSWSRARRFVVPAGATEFPQPTLEQLRERIGRGHPRLFVNDTELKRLKTWTAQEGRAAWEKFRARADELVEKGAPTAEPAVKASPYDPATNQYWWSNRIQTIRALHEAETLTFAWLVTRESRYREPARKFVLRLVEWDPDGPTSFKLNCEAAKPMLHRLARAYDWGYDLFTAEERERIRSVMRRRAQDAWTSSEVRGGAGHLNQPYSSHGNRTWHKLAEWAVATLGETPEAERTLHYAVTKFFAAYPVWSDDDGGWHEGLSYFAGYMSKAAWWMDLAQHPLGIDGFRKPFFRHFADYALYSAPPGTVSLGLGDLAFRPPGPGWAFLHYYVRRTGNPYWAWWLEEWRIPAESDEPALGLLWAAAPAVPAKPPVDLAPSKVFRGTGVAVLNVTLVGAAENVQVRFKASPMGRWSHGHEPHNSFTLDAYGEALLVNNVYRDLYGTPFHKDWVWSTRAQNAVLVNGEGQKPRSADLGGRILRWQLEDGFDYLVGDATDAYEGRLKKAWRHVVFVKPTMVVIADELEAPRPSTFEWMLHGQQEFQVEEGRQQLRLERDKGGVVVDYVAEAPLKFRQWTGYTPEPDWRYLKSINSPGIPPQWHVEAASPAPALRALTLTVARPYRRGQAPREPLKVERQGGAVEVSSGDASIRVAADGPVVASARRGERAWAVKRAAE